MAINVKLNDGVTWKENVTENGLTYLSETGYPIHKSEVEWTELVTDKAGHADEVIRMHLKCANIDTESQHFSCYTHSLTVKWIG